MAQKKKPYRKAYFEITNVCNLNCSFCPKTLRKPCFVSVSQAEKALRQIALQADTVHFHVMGEPLFHPQLEDLLKVAEGLGLSVSITTNGTLLGEKGGCLIASPAVRRICVSLHSFEANQAGDFDAYLSGVAEFCESAGEKLIQLRLWNLDGEAKGRNTQNGRIAEFLQNRWNLLPQTLAEGGRLFGKVYVNYEKCFHWPNAAIPVQNRLFCHGLRDQFGVLADGTVVPCCLDSEGSMALGNLYAEPLENILQAPRARRIYNGFSARTAVDETCRHCGYARRFSR